MDNNSDEDIEIDVSAAVTLEGVQFAHHSFSVKRPRTQHTDGQAKPTLTSAIPPITARTFEVVGTSTNDNQRNGIRCGYLPINVMAFKLFKNAESISNDVDV